MEYEKIKQLIDDMGDSKLTSISIDFPDGTKISMTKQDENVKVVTTEATETKVDETTSEEAVKEEPKGNIVKSPMVGTFYSKPAPDADPYVEVGDTVKKGETVCIIEAMKLMNEIGSDFDGEIAEIFLKDGDSVEYGTPLFRVQ